MSASRIYPAAPLPEAELIDRYRNLASSLVSDALNRWSGNGLLPISGVRPGQVVVGPAITVRTRAGDNLAVHKALDIARPGEVLVVDARGAVDRAIVGGLMGAYASQQGLAGLVIDGAVRDLRDLEEKAPPVWARTLNQLGPYKDGPGDIRCPVTISGVVVNAGDIVIADEDGVTVVPRDRAEEIVVLAEQKAAAEAEEFAAIERGEWDRSWVDRALQPVEIE